MLFWVSIANNHTGKFVGAAIVNADTALAAGDIAVKQTRQPHDMEAQIAPVPKDKPVPPGLEINKVHNREELEKHFPDLMSVTFCDNSQAIQDGRAVGK